MADNCKYSKNNIHNWKDRWDVKFYTYGELMEKTQTLGLRNEDPTLGSKKMFYTNIIGRVDKNARFISEQDLKMILMNINTEEAKVFRNWLLRMATIVKKIINKLTIYKSKQSKQKYTFLCNFVLMTNKFAKCEFILTPSVLLTHP